ncbi:ABC transporter permease subunit [Rhizobium sp. RAF56]|jgi:hypothetical protein|uniref:ABC transporter permease subunit n=1 Tax=Rhizobium sp. RAF56 TaxID=3233062 RepID=UPI003F9B9F5F
MDRLADIDLFGPKTGLAIEQIIASAAVLGLGVNEGSYLTEEVRVGGGSVDQGQKEAAHTLGMTPGQTMRRIVLPQTLRLILPFLGNSAIGMLKFSRSPQPSPWAKCGTRPSGFTGTVTLSNMGSKDPPFRILSSGGDCHVAPSLHRRCAKGSVGGGRCQMALDIERVVCGGVD